MATTTSPPPSRSRPDSPARDAASEPAAVNPRRVYAAMLLCVAVTWLLSSEHLVAIAGRGAFGPRRDAFLAVTEAVHAVAVAVRLDRPEAWMAAALGRSAGPGPAGGADGRTAGLRGPTPAAAAALGTATPDGSAVAPGTSAMGPGAGSGAAGTRSTSPATSRPLATAPAPRRRISPDRPLRIHVAGDSFAQPLGQELAAAGVASGMAAVDLDFRISSGLARPDYFDWTRPMVDLARRPEPPDAVVIFMGANDDQNMITAGERVVQLTTPEWRAEYRRRAAGVMDAFSDRRVGVVLWIGLPIMRDPLESQVARDINAALEAEAAERPWMRFVDIWPTFADANGNFAAYLPDANDRMVQVRQVDGVHLQREGTRQVAAIVYAGLGRIWDLTPPTATPTTTSTRTPAAASPTPAAASPTPAAAPSSGSTAPARSPAPS